MWLHVQGVLPLANPLATQLRPIEEEGPPDLVDVKSGMLKKNTRVLNPLVQEEAPIPETLFTEIAKVSQQLTGKIWPHPALEQ